MERWIDLHTHTNYSDGELTPTELVRYATQNGLSAIAITDHGSINGVNEAIQAGEELAVEVVSGIEISVDYSLNEIKQLGAHIVGLFVDVNNEELINYCYKSREAVIKRVKHVLAKLSEINLDVSFDEYCAYVKCDAYSSYYIAQYLIQKGYAKDYKDAKELYVGKTGAAYVKKEFENINFKEGIKLIQQAGGVAILAHPVLYHLELPEFEKLFADMKQAGLDGVEVYCSGKADGLKQSPFVSKLLIEFAKEFRLTVSGGSDFHGVQKLAQIQIGTGIDNNLAIPYSVLDKLKKHIKIISVGTAAVDHNLSRNKVHVGGCQLNCAVFAKILGYHTSDYLGVLANDASGRIIKDTLTQYGVGHNNCRIETGETPHCKFEIIDGEREFKGFDKGVAKSHPLVLSSDDSAYISNFNIVFTGRTANIDTQLSRIPHHCLVVYDCQYNESELTFLSNTVDMIIFSGAKWSKDKVNKQIENSHKKGIPCVLVTLGGRGQVFSFNGQRVNGYAAEVNAVDTLGCGDSFSTAFVLRLFESGWRKSTLPKLKSVENALSVASEFAARIATTNRAFGVCADVEGSDRR